ncbi:hypothetical protein FOA52_005351 [Chlamydomonas sp. UWO 241]|nr:hypothetical protein FOA52_005351 [Chlamydomonas sp. UWO 241]
MFEAQVAYYLNQYLGKYLTGLDAESLKISVWAGDVQLRNLSLKPEALADLELPVTVKAGMLGKLTLKVPWNKLGQAPVVVEFDRLYIVAGPKEESEMSGKAEDVESYEEQVDEVEFHAKMQRCTDSEKKFLTDLDARGKGAKASKGGADQPLADRMGFMALIDKILGNLQIKISNVHIRYEDGTLGESLAAAGSPGSRGIGVGVMLQEVVAQTVDASGNVAFVTEDVLQCLRKAVSLSKLCAYFDVDSAPLHPPRRGKWSDMDVAEWDDLFLPARHYDEMCYTHDFLICPVSGGMKYARRSRKFRVNEQDPKQEMSMNLQQVQLQYSRQQYGCTQQLLQAVELFQANAPYRYMRPHGRPAAGAQARIWWRYALRCVRKQLHTSRSSWKDLQHVIATRRRYVPHYARCVEVGKIGGDEAIEGMDRHLPEGAITMFRRLAHASAEASRWKALEALDGAWSTGMGASVAPRVYARGARRDQRKQRTWGEYMWGGQQAQPQQPQQSQQEQQAQQAQLEGGGGSGGGGGGGAKGVPDVGSMRGNLTAEEWGRLEELLAEKTLKDEDESKDTPFTVRIRLAVTIARASARLVEERGSSERHRRVGTALLHLAQHATAPPLAHGSSGSSSSVGDSPRWRELCVAGMDALTLSASQFPTTLEVTAAVGRASVETEAGPLFSTAAGAELAGGGKSAGSAFAMSFVSKPQDGSADAVVDLNIAPSFATYSPGAVSGITGFFAPVEGTQGLQLTTLQAQAAARAEQLRKLAQFQLRSLSAAEEKPKLQLSLSCHAPKAWESREGEPPGRPPAR